MKLYAIRDKNTGEWLEGPASNTRLTAYEDKAECEAVKDYFPEKEPVTVTLRVEPTEPCEFCRDPDDLIVARYKPRKPGDPDPMMVAVEALDPELCPMCGRRLT